MMLFLRTLLFIFAALLFADGLLLILHKKWHLGTLLPVLIGFICGLYALFMAEIHQYLSDRMALKKLWIVCWSLFCVWLVSVLAFFAYLHTQIQHADPTHKIEAIIVLGSGVIQGQPSPTLALRLDRAAQVSEKFPNALIIVSGGQDFGEVNTEADVMSAYLHKQHHISPDKIALEDQSTSTELNLKNSQPILKDHRLSLNSSIAVVTSDFHTLRSNAIAQNQGYTQLSMISAPTPLMTRYNAWLREYFAYLSGWLLNEY